MKRRGRDRRRSPTTTCQRCGGTLRRIGQPGIGAQILKCSACGIMDRRLPVERRLELVDARPVGPWWRPLLVKVAASFAVGGAVAWAVSRILPTFNP